MSGPGASAPGLVQRHPGKAVAGSLAAGIVLASSLLAGLEGMRTHAYLDSGGLATICEGLIVYEDGRRVKLGDVVDVKTCIDMRDKDVTRRVAAMQKCLTRPVSPVTAAWMILYGYNAGVGAFCTRVAPLANRGRMIAACTAMLKPDTVHHVVVRGLVIRRAKESRGCFAGLA